MKPTDYIGRPLVPRVVLVERGPAANFATAVKDDSAVYQRPDAAKEAGFAGIPVPPTYSFAMHHWGAFAELQPEAPADAVRLDDLISALRAEGGLIMHAEQEFEYFAPIVVGDLLRVTGVVEDVYTKTSSSGRQMTFAKVRTEVRNEAEELVVRETMTLLHRP